MKSGFSDALKQRAHRPGQDCFVATEAFVRSAEDVRARRDEWNAGTKTNVTLYDDGKVMLTGSSAAKMESTSQNGYITDLNNARPYDIFAWELDESIGPNSFLTKMQLWLDRKNNGGQPVFDGFFKLTMYRIRAFRGLLSNQDGWQMQQVGDPVVVNAATMSADQQLVDFDFTQSADFPGVYQPGILIDGSFRPENLGNVGYFIGNRAFIVSPQERVNGRTVVALLTAFGGSNTNYGMGRDSALANKITTGGQGTLRHYIASQPLFSDLGGEANNPLWWRVTGGTGMIRGGFFLGSYGPSATGSVAFTGGNKCDFGASVQGSVEFVCRGATPAGTTLVFQARVNGGDAWVNVKDGQAPADVGLASSQFYEMQVLLTANAGGDSSPSVFALGIIDRVLFDLTEVATLDGFSESVDILSGEVKMAAPTLTLQHTGAPDARDIATILMSSYDFVQVEVRCWLAHKDLPRDQWMLLHIWRVDDHDDTPTQLKLYLVSVLERMRGRFPLGSGQLFGWMLKQANSDLTGGADFTKELSEATETGSTLNFTIAASATEDQLGYTKAGVPNLQKWPTGNWSVQVNVTVANTNLQLSVAVARVNAAGTQQQISRFTPEQQCSSGVKTFQLFNLAWNAGAVGDRIKIIYRFRNTVASGQAVTIETGTTNTQVQAPWFPLSSQGTKRYNMETVQAVYTDWRDSQVALAERYRGNIPADTTTLIAKNVLDSDGKRELERIAFCGKGTVIGSQGLVHFVPLYETRQMARAWFHIREITPLSMAPGLRARVPELFASYGFDTVKKDDFAGEAKIVHAAALAKFGHSRIDNPTRKIEEDIAKWFPDAGVALSIGTPFVLSLATGQIIWRFRSNIPHPELDLGDMVLVETNTFTMRDPNTGEPIRGFTAAYGIIVEVEGLMGDVFGVWLRSLSDLYSVDVVTIRRTPFETPYVQAVINSIVGAPQSALVTLQAFPQTTTTYYYVHADGTVPPDRDSPLWTLYTTGVTVSRSASADTLFSYWAMYNGIASPVFTSRVSKDELPEILTITLHGTASFGVEATIQADGDTGSIKFVGRKTGFPSLADVQAAASTNGRNVTGALIDAATGSAMVLNTDIGEVAYVSAVAYSRVSAGGVEGPLAQARFSVVLRQRRYILTASGNFVAPADWNNSNNSIEGIGGGAGGAAGTTNARGGGGGGGGEYRKASNVTLEPGTSYPFGIGGGGAAGTSSGQNGGNGGSTTFNTSTMIAANGAGGLGSNPPTGGAGGTGGTGAGGNRNGGNGAAGTVSTNGSGGGGGGAAGPTAGGGNGSGTSGGAGQANIWGSNGAGAGGSGGTPPTPVAGTQGGLFGSGGGGGACTPSAFSAGAAGRAGILVITWYS